MTLSSEDLRLLEAALRTLLPTDSETEKTAILDYVLGIADRYSDHYRAGLILLRENAFLDMGETGRIALLERLEGHPSIALMTQHAIEGLYISPVGFAIVGFRVTA